MAQIVIFSLYISLFFYQLSTISAPTPHLCTNHNALLLLQFKQSFQIYDDASYLCEPSSLKTLTSWNKSIDCCLWKGVTCDEFTGDVIGLDLSCSGLQGVINSNSTLFQLSRLHNLNLACNDFYPSLISTRFAEFQELTHLNLSSSLFSGTLPLEFCYLSNLISLDLSVLDIGPPVSIQPDVFKSLIQNLTQLREVALESANVSSKFPHNLSTSLQVLNLQYMDLFGEVSVETFQLPNLQELRLSYNFKLTGSLSKVEWNTSSTLSYLDLSCTGLSGRLPESIGNLKSLSNLDLSYSYFSGSIPASIGNLTQLTFLYLSENNFSGPVPSTLENLWHGLTYLDLSQNSLGGRLPNFFRNFNNLLVLSLGANQFIGHFVSEIIMNLTKLQYLDLSYSSLTGHIPSSIINLTNLQDLDLSHNSLTGPLPPNIGEFQNHLKNNSLNNTIPAFWYLPGISIFLEGNELHGQIPKSISKLVNLEGLDLSDNNFSGDVEVSLFSNMKQLRTLGLSFNSLSLVNNQVNSTLPPSLEDLSLASCGVKDLDFLIGANTLEHLDLSHNKIHGQIFLDEKWNTWGQLLLDLNLSHNFLTHFHQLSFQGLEYLDISSNRLSGPLFVPSVEVYFASNNNFTGELPSLMCNITQLEALDLSNNRLSGLIPQCLGNTTELWVLDLHKNNFHGIIPSGFSVGSQLTHLILHNNWLEGVVPLSLSNCKELQVVDIGHNSLNGTFPWWLQKLSKLQVLNLRANHLCGPLAIYGTGLSFPELRILDLSDNEFTGILPAKFFLRLEGMKIVNRVMEPTMFVDRSLYYKVSVVIIDKGVETDIVSVISMLTAIDLSNNRFEGTIPDAIGDLISLQFLNLSHNKFRGQISSTFRNLTILESLDLSSNQLEGEIPPQLTALTFLSVLNLSQNHLVGRIPQGHQFDTFENVSYLGNDGLCGFPLSKICGAENGLMMPPPSATHNKEEFISGFTWEAVLIGYLSGMVIGLSIGYLSFMTGKPKWFNKMVEQEGGRLIKKKWCSREVKWLSR